MDDPKSRSLPVTRRGLLGGALLAGGAVLTAVGARSAGAAATRRGRVLVDRVPAAPRGLREAVEMPLIEAIQMRRARRFSLGAEIADGALAFKSRHAPVPLSSLEQMVVLTAVGGNTGWHNMHIRHKKYAPHLSNYAAAAGGRTFPSAAGFHTS